MKGKGHLILGLALASLLYIPSLYAAAGCDGAGNCYIRQGATGTGNGADWTNACTDLAGSCTPVRGVTYYIAAGLYGSQVWNTSVSGTTMINIFRATVAAHGTSTGWSNSFDGQATFSWDNSTERAIQIETGYWDVDGITGSGAGVANYGFKIAAPGDTGGPACSSFSGQAFDFTFGGSGGTTAGVTVEHVGMTGCNGSIYAINATALGLGCGACFLTNFTIEHNYSTFNNDFFDLTNLSNSTMAYNIGDNFLTTPGIHAEVIAVTSYPKAGACSSPCTANDVFAYNQIWNCRSSACMESVVSGGDVLNVVDWQIYGNTFGDDESGDGVFAANMSGTTIVQNTLVNVGRIAPNTTGGSGNTIENNIFYQAISNIGNGIAHDYNTYWNPSDSGASETHGQIVSGSTCPLVSCSITAGPGNYALAAGGDATNCASTTAVCAGTPLSAPYNVDMNGTTFGANGTWDRGAFQLGTSAARPNAPQNLTATPQ